MFRVTTSIVYCSGSVGLNSTISVPAYSVGVCSGGAWYASPVSYTSSLPSANVNLTFHVQSGSSGCDAAYIVRCSSGSSIGSKFQDVGPHTTGVRRARERYEARPGTKPAQ